MKIKLCKKVEISEYADGTVILRPIEIISELEFAQG
jgi:hypothetical protein